ncbi:hypothetical protein E4T42_09323 [Aureobasidium subglaciale]|nr:hypothetical protein E4T38_06430 [Aureobasidium subglaciale]KAI5219347.1 hypothetical protein E4T40_06452 [Aureobasidium subglaciale]KAI5222994.1 hypothetical protein E4T41_06292 [Aureobasidium subglaciale]KAI5236901.1 hypothetical protein E4T42_09323 [Aureobasidium subglaciale]KAI5260336.1 hypothetical protein E4T46_06082 [Aureobasidium subglaciale]
MAKRPRDVKTKMALQDREIEEAEDEVEEDRGPPIPHHIADLSRSLQQTVGANQKSYSPRTNDFSGFRLAPGANIHFSLTHLSRVYVQPILFASFPIYYTRRNHC